MDNPDLDTRRDLERVADFLVAISARLLQVSDRKAGVAMGVATNAVVGSAFAASITGIVGSLGTAGTGAAIAGLSGAAKTSATLAWIGGIVGGGMAAGTVVLGAGALGAGIYGSIRFRRVILGYARRSEDLSEAEQRIVEAAGVLTVAIRNALAVEEHISGREVAVLSRVAVEPLLADVEAALKAGLLDDLNTFNRARLRGHVINLRSHLRRLEANADPS
ncbi:hypothetical protein [Palleronia marisminoris]|nr:hypothetical protein [Palleronia marisminoris]